MSYGMSILGPTNVVPLKPNSPSPTSRIASSQSRATPLPRVTKSSRENVMTSPRRLSITSPALCVREPPKQQEVLLLCSGQSCLRAPEDTGSRPNGSDAVRRGPDVAGVGWRVRWRPLDVSEYVASDFGFRRQRLSESLGMTQRKSIRSRKELERDIVSTAHRHISACQLPGAVKPSSRAATNFADLKEALAVSGGHDWTSAAECRDQFDEDRGIGEWQGDSVMRRRMGSSSGVGSRGPEDHDGRSSGKRAGLCRGLAFVNYPSSSSSSSSSSYPSLFTIALDNRGYSSDHIDRWPQRNLIQVQNPFMVVLRHSGE